MSWMARILIGIGVLIIALPFYIFIDGTIRTWSASSWPVAPGRVAAGRIATTTGTDSDGDPTTSHDVIVTFDYAVAGRRYRMPRMTGALVDTLRRRFEDLLARDLANVEAGLYPRELLFQMPLGAYTRRLPLLLGEMRRAAARARRGDHTLPDAVDAETLPHYYRRTFHWQPDGYLSRRSAEAYDVGVELVFRGTADLMRRQIIPPVTRWLRARGGGGATLVDLACGTGRTLRQLEVAPPQISTLGVDLSRPYLDVAARLTRARLLVANAEALPLATGAARHLIQSPPLFPLENPGILSIPLGFLGAFLGTLTGREPSAEAKYTELVVRANTGLGAEKASTH
jgi:hypothetical protein